MGKIEDLEKIEDLKNKGILTQEEFDIEKKKILEQDNKDNIDNPTKTLKNKLKSKKILFILITLGVTILITIIVLIIAFNKKVENEDNADNEDDTKMNINPIATMEIENYGTIKIELYPEQAPNTVKNFIALANNGFYDGLTFHRTIPDFIIQGGDPSGDGTGNSRLEDIGLNSDEKYTIPGEFAVNGYINNTLKHKRGVISMARADYISFSDSLTDESYNSASCQFFIMVEDYASLDGLYSPFGEVIEGIEIVDKIANVEVETREAQEDDKGLMQDRPVTPPVIKSIRVETYGVNYGLPNTLKYFDISEWYYANITNNLSEKENNTNFLEEIKEKYPTESSMICTNGTDYWLLDEEGDKIYFYDLTSFETALQQCNMYINNNYSNEEDKSNIIQDKKEWSYTPIPICGCIIIDSNTKTGEISYKKKCENCGNIDNTVNTTIHTTGILNNSYYCPKCKNMQEVQIEVISEYK